MINYFLLGLIILFCGAVFSLFIKRAKIRLIFSFLTHLSAFFVCAYPAISVLLSNNTIHLNIPYPLPYLNLAISIDKLSAFFIIPVLLICALASFYAISYLSDEKSGRTYVFYFNILTGSMLSVLTANNALIFLFFWELMALSSFFLVLTGNNGEEIRRASWIYIVSSHFGMFFLISMFFLLYFSCGSLDFEFMSKAIKSGALSNAIFLLSFVGFGSKCGFIPFHVWLPRAHPAAPSHVSAVMSGVMIKIGIYGILRTIQILGGINLFCASVVLITGLLSAFIAIIFALVQNDFKKLLAYSSIENIGIILIGIGFSAIAAVNGQKYISIIALAGALMHAFNHSIFKSLLFFCAGAIIKVTEEHDINKMGGLLKRMPFLGGIFILGSSAISSIPFLNGFAGEFLILLSAFLAITEISGGFVLLVSVASILVLLFVTAIVMATFVKAAGIIFLGEFRGKDNNSLKEPKYTLLLSPLILSVICLVIGLGAGYFLYFPLSVSSDLLSTFSSIDGTYDFSSLSKVFNAILCIFSGFFIICSILLLLRFILPRQSEVCQTVTWDCGYAAPSSRMQYSGSSLVAIIADAFSHLLEIEYKKPDQSFIYPANEKFKFSVPNFLENSVFARLVKGILSISNVLCKTESFTIHFQILLLFITLILLLGWSFIYV